MNIQHLPWRSFSLKVFWPGFVLNLAEGGKIYRLYRVPLQKMGNGTIRVMSPELGKDLLPNLGVLANVTTINNFLTSKCLIF